MSLLNFPRLLPFYDVMMPGSPCVRVESPHILVKSCLCMFGFMRGEVLLLSFFVIEFFSRKNELVTSS